jgi:hypothetical protein
MLKSRHSERTTVKFTRKAQMAIEEEVGAFKMLLVQSARPLFVRLNRWMGNVGGLSELLKGDVQAGCRDSSLVAQTARRWASSRQCVIDG